MSNTSIEQMKKIIEEKKKKDLQQGTDGRISNKFNSGPNRGFKNTKRSGSLNK